MALTLEETREVLKDRNNKFIIFHDTETTGTLKTDRILQSAHALYVLDEENKDIVFIDFLEENILPPVAISPGSAAVHGIWYPDLEGAPEWKNSLSKEFFELFIENNVFYCAHNSDFDIGQLEKEGIYYPSNLVIDTLQIAKHFNVDNEDIESNGLQYLRYYYNFDMSPDFKDFLSDYGIEKLQPHTALSDIAVLAYYYVQLMKMNAFKSAEEAVDLTNTYVFTDKVSFGNVFEQGTKISEAITSSYKQYGKNKRGIDYFNWAISNMGNISPDTKITLAKIAIEKTKTGDLSIHDSALTPFKYIAATFLPEYDNYLSESGFNVSQAKEATIKNIKKSIQEIEEAGEEDKRYSPYANLKKILKYIQD